MIGNFKTHIHYSVKILEKWLFPYVCIICHLRSDTNRDLCSFCKNELPWILNPCTQCGARLTGVLLQKCGGCLKSPRPFDQTIALFHYENPIVSLIKKLKFHNNLVYARVLGQLLVDRIIKHYSEQCLPEYIIPIPLHCNRLKERGYNQALELARPISKTLGIPIEYTSCQRVIATQPQTSLSAEQRNKNIRNAFQVAAEFNTNHVAVIDDVITTSSTMTEFCNTLRKRNIAKIDVWCIAKTTH
jgi:ComF family protein